MKHPRILASHIARSTHTHTPASQKVPQKIPLDSNGAV